jgi:S1-C subfamily serine protease
MRISRAAALFAVFAGVIPICSLADQQSSGSGFGIAGGTLLVTSNHVVDGCTRINIPDVGSAIILRTDPRSDLAILKSSPPLPAGLRFRSGQSVKLGEEVVVIGFPLRGLLSSPPTVTTGIVSSLAGLRDDRTEMQISAPVQPGNSGGPVLDRSGNVVGVVESKLDAIKAAVITGDIPQNVNFAVHSEIVTSFLDSYALRYDTGTRTEDKPISELVSAVLPAIAVVECIGEKANVASSVPVQPVIPRGQAQVPETASMEQRALEVTRAFYSALAKADGASASQLVIPEKQAKGPFAASEITRFYSSLSAPLRVLDIRPESADTVAVTYEYGSPDRRSCRGASVVNLTTRGTEFLIQTIHANNNCGPP